MARWAWAWECGLFVMYYVHCKLGRKQAEVKGRGRSEQGLAGLL